MKPKKCKQCQITFTPERPFQHCCTLPCAIKYAREGQRKAYEKRRRKETREARERLKSRSQVADEAERAFRRYIRARDRKYYADLGKLPECISCGTNNPEIQYAAGHFKTKGGHPELRYDEKNAYLQCNHRCNKQLSGNINGTKDTHGYREGLKIRFGENKANEIIDYLESYHPPKNWSIDELNDMKDDFNRRARELEKENG